MIILWAIATLGAARAECSGISDTQLHLVADAPALGVVSLEIPLLGSSPEPKNILTVLAHHKLHATLLPTHRWASKHANFLKNAAEAGHEVGVWISLKDDIGLTGEYASEPDYSDWVDAIRYARRHTRLASGQRPVTMATSTLVPIAEMAAEAIGFRAILPSERTIADRPRRARNSSQNLGRAMVIGQGHYPDGCGHLLPQWSPAALDRATHAAARAQWVRVGLPPHEGVAPILDMWLTEVVIPQQWPVLTVKQLAKAAKRAKDETPRPIPNVPVPKRIPQDRWTAVASAIATANPLPRVPSPGLNLTEAFFGLVTVLAGEHPRAASGPRGRGNRRPPGPGSRSARSLGSAEGFNALGSALVSERSCGGAARA